MLRRRRGRIVFAIALVAVIVALDFGVTFYRVYTAPAPTPIPVPTIPVPAMLSPEYKRLEFAYNGLYWSAKPFRGEYYNIDSNGIRRTVGQPMHYEHTLWLFGNSTVFGPAVSDADTIASRLQAILIEHGWRTRVVNVSANGQSIGYEFEWLKTINARPGDSIVFLDGIMDEPDPVNYHRIAALIAVYARSHGLFFFHYMQPTLVDRPALGRRVFSIPPNDFVDTNHMLAGGSEVAAQELFDLLTLI